MSRPLEACQYPHASGHAYKTIPRQLETEEFFLVFFCLFVLVHLFLSLAENLGSITRVGPPTLLLSLPPRCIPSVHPCVRVCVCGGGGGCTCLVCEELTQYYDYIIISFEVLMYTFLLIL